MRLALIAGCLTAVFAVAACGSSNKSSTNSSTTSTGTSAASSKPSGGGLPIVLKNYKFVPNVIAGQGGHTIALHLKNTGSVEHNFSVTSLHIDKDLGAGKSATVKVTLPKSGSLQFFCSYHKASHNMVGSFRLGGASATAPPSTGTTSTSSGGGSGY